MSGGGTVSASLGGNAVQIGRFAGTGNGTLMITGANTTLRTTSTVGDILVGVAGNGTLSLVNGGRAESADDIFIGNAAGSRGSIVISGIGEGVMASLVATSATSGDLIVGNLGTDTLAAQGGGVANIGHDVLVAPNVGSSGTVNLQAVFPGETLIAGRNLDIGHNTTAGTAAGTGVMTIANGCSATVGGVTFIGDPDGGAGSLQLDGTASMLTHGLTIDNTNGTLTFNGGTLSVDSGVVTPKNTTFVLNGSGDATPLFRL